MRKAANFFLFDDDQDNSRRKPLRNIFYRQQHSEPVRSEKVLEKEANKIMV